MKTWDTDVDFKADAEITKTWIMPLTKIKQTQPHQRKKIKANDDEVKDFEHAIALYRDFNGVGQSEIVMTPVWMPDATSPLVALGENECPFVDYLGKTNKDGELDTYIHHFGEDDDGKITKERPRIYVRSLLRATNPSS